MLMGFGSALLPVPGRTCPNPRTSSGDISHRKGGGHCWRRPGSRRKWKFYKHSPESPARRAFARGGRIYFGPLTETPHRTSGPPVCQGSAICTNEMPSDTRLSGLGRNAAVPSGVSFGDVPRRGPTPPSAEHKNAPPRYPGVPGR